MDSMLYNSDQWELALWLFGFCLSLLAAMVVVFQLCSIVVGARRSALLELSQLQVYSVSQLEASQTSAACHAMTHAERWRLVIHTHCTPDSNRCVGVSSAQQARVQQALSGSNPGEWLKPWHQADRVRDLTPLQITPDFLSSVMTARVQECADKP
ncbi:hypothetical protein DPEC_G00114840 [Dallia pectoralis]|uniref:Uncharacterized protein n=1 Tax=Dallia pectoralis TaxID=75939 RepID=A0ACC2GUV4_DALPE|nr:hypothetical protein DPEC_G00114840 [Dallia pectoralis]